METVQPALTEGVDPDIERAFQVLEVYGVPRERARTVANGIEVLMQRMNKAGQAAQAQPISTLLDGATGLYAVGDTRYPEKLVPVFKDAYGKVWSMKVDEVLRTDGWHPSAIVFSGPHAPPSWMKT